MENVELLQAVSELVSIAATGIAEAIHTLPADVEDSAAEDVLQVCAGHIDMIVMAAEMAALPDLQQQCLEINTILYALHGAAHYFKTHRQHLLEWSQAVAAYVEQPADTGPPLCLLLLPEEEQTTVDALPVMALAEPAETDVMTLAEMPGVETASVAEEQAPAWPDASDLAWLETTAADTETTPEDTLDDGAEAIDDDDAEVMKTASAPVVDTSSTAYVTATITAEPAETFWGPHASDAPAVGDDAVDNGDQAAACQSATEESAARALAFEAALPLSSLPEESAATDTALEEGEDNAAAEYGVLMTLEEGGDNAAAEYDVLAQFQQLLDLFAALEPWHDMLTSALTGETEVAAASHAYNDLMGRIQEMSVDLELAGLDVVCAHIITNVVRLASQPPAARAAARQVLEQWATLALGYISDPANDTQGLALITQLQQDAWPEPLTPELAAALCQTLCPDTTEEIDVAPRPNLAQPEDVVLSIAEDVNPRLLEVFLQESPVHAADFSACITRIGQGQEVFANLRTAQRLAHNMKGSANLVGVKGVANLTHHIEDILEYLSEHHSEPPSALIPTLQEAADCIETMFEALQGVAAPPSEAQRVLQDVFDWANRMDMGQLHAAIAASPIAVKPVTAPPPLVAEVPVAPPQVAPPESPGAAEAQTVASAPGKILRIPVATVDRLYRMVGEMSIALDQLQDRFTLLERQSNELRQHNRLLQQRRFEMESFIDIRHVSMTQRQLRRIGSGREGFDPLELNAYDELYSTSRSFIEAVTDSTRMQQQWRSELSAAERMLGQIQRLKRDLETTVRGTRMEEVSTISARLQRSVRQASRVTGKNVELEIEGADVLLDSEILDKLADPLMHILRNAVDHGIESAEQRVQRGKPAHGTIRLRFFQESNTVVVQCRDDGRGLDYDSIRQTAVSKGLLQPGEASSPQALARLTLTAGFSTRTTATQLSGRGVGLDVVYTTIKELKGVMDIGDASSGGCQIVLRLPLTLLTSHCLVVSVAGQPYAIPTSAVARALPPRSGHLSPIGTEMAFELGQAIYTARSLAQHLHLTSGEATDFTPEHAILLVYSDAGVVALLVDQLLDNYHLVVKNLGPYIKAVRGVAGLATLADGRLVPVLDVAELLRTTSQTAISTDQEAVPRTPIAPPAAAKVLIVDDSLSVRQSLSDLLTDAGYETLLAHDGVEAVNVLRTSTPDLVLTDIEMPRMNGLELVSYIRTTHSRELPVIVVTSRTTQKHRQQAMDVGVSLYVTKPYAEETLLSNIQSFLN
jgi:chemosensory pili system protein ChpA (sensor histidine kinase/response regulator)